MIAYEEGNSKLRFGLAWVSANVIGIGLGWPIAEYVGSTLSKPLGGIAAMHLAMVVYETILWSMRGAVIAGTRSAGTVKKLDAAILIFMEIAGWLLGDFLYASGTIATSGSIAKGGLLNFTTGSYLASWYGSFVWLILWLIRVQMRKPAARLSPAKAILGSAWRISASLLIFAVYMLGPLLASELGDGLARTAGRYFGMAAEGSVFGLYVGTLSAMAMVQFLGAPGVQAGLRPPGPSTIAKQ